MPLGRLPFLRGEPGNISPSPPVGGVFTAKAALQAKGNRPVEKTLPWS
jgi:hypothetical protein